LRQWSRVDFALGPGPPFARDASPGVETRVTSGCLGGRRGAVLHTGPRVGGRSL